MIFIIRYVFIFLLFLSFLSPIWAMNDQDFQKQARQKFPDETKVHVYQDIENIFSPILHSNVKGYFLGGFKTLYEKSIPFHENEKIVEGFRCLYTDMLAANALADKVKTEDAQYTTFNNFFAHAGHKKVIQKWNPPLAAKVKNFEWDDQKETAELELGIEKLTIGNEY